MVVVVLLHIVGVGNGLSENFFNAAGFVAHVFTGAYVMYSFNFKEEDVPHGY
ncbi:hypothetical protein KSP39_PZI016881 [Platanthera zijinensis]|uniref:Uncharacterized protein n=1 Tax=Platanthera zijinensis TaxID=2320716 RepID=A0AAP0G0J5_9ASPA